MKLNKIFAAGLVLFLIGSQVFAKAKYISPNNDGEKDELKIPLSISDKRFIQGWSLVILDSNKEVVRVIENKVALPEKIGFKSFFKQLITPKQGVAVPDYVIWNGALDNGETAPDGQYFYYITATDDNGNVGKTKEYEVVVDTVAPDIELAQPGDKIFGEGAKASFKVRQSGSKEDLWTGVFKNAEGEVVREYKWTTAEPAEFSWHGTDNDGAQVKDGVYSYEIKAVDKAGNVSPQATITNIIYSSERPATNIYVNGSRYFSPDTDSALKTVTFNVTIPVPDAKSGNSLVEWNVDIEDKATGQIVKSFNQTTDGPVPSNVFVFDGKDNNGKLLKDGKYQASVTAKYSNGSVPDKISSAEIILDTKKPEVFVSSSDKVFGAGSKDSVKFTIRRVPDQEGAIVSSWNAVITTEDGATVVKTYKFNEIEFGETQMDEVVLTWNGITDNGSIAEKGQYVMTLTAEDAAGNAGGGKAKDLITFDTTEAQLVLAMSDNAFSPNGNKVKDTISFTPVTATKDVAFYTFEIMDSKNKVVYSVSEEKKLPASIEWDGKDNGKILCADGNYVAKLSVVAANGSTAEASTQKFELDTVYPKLSAETLWSSFSPDGDGNQDTVVVKITESTNEKLWTADVRDSKDKTVKKYTWNGNKNQIEWNGTDEAGNVVADGKYNIIIYSTDDAGNNFSTELKGLVLDNRETKAYVTAEYEGISPNNDNVLDVQKFGIQTSVADGIKAWSFSVVKEDGTAVYKITNADQPNLPASITWNGAYQNGDNKDKACEGTFTGVLNIEYLKGNIVNTISSPFICTATPPQLKVRTAPEYFSPDNDGIDDDLYIKLTGSTKANIKNWSFVIYDPKGKAFWKTNGKSQITERIVWDGLSNVQKNANGRAERVQSAMDYPYVFTVTDNLGMTSVLEGVISIDVLVIREGTVLKMAVPSIIFESDSANFQTAKDGKLTKEQIEKNLKTLDRIADILKKFKDYKVTIEGHANRLTDDPNEELVDNASKWGRASTPLSKERSDAIKAYLVKKGVNAASLSTNGLGGTKPVVNPKDKDNNWKNRRVEFILVK